MPGRRRGVHADAAVVGKGAAAGQLRDLPGLLFGVFHEAAAILYGFVLDARFPHGEDLIEHTAENGLDLCELVGIIGSDYQFHLSSFLRKGR